jgi:membrane-bound lytic murein transglycosylase A
MVKILPILLSLSLQFCARAPLEDIKENMRAANYSVEFNESQEFKGLDSVIVKTIERMKEVDGSIQVGEKRISMKDYIEYLREVRKILKKTKDAKEFQTELMNISKVYEVYGRDDWSEVLVTAYYTPVIKGNRRRGKKYSRPLYKKPRDLVKLRVSAYKDIYEDFKIVSKEDEISKLRGRLTEDGYVVPYWKREDIDLKGELKGKKLEIAWVDPVEAFFMQIQGSGKVDLPGRRDIYVHYSDQNGHEFYPIGKELLDIIPLEEMSMQRIKEHLRSLPKDEQDKILAKDPSYVFFEAEKTRPITSFGTQVVDHRTIATDYRYYNNGLLGFLKFSDQSVPSRYVIDQDTGGGLKGRGRVDLYVGEGKDAADIAGGFKQPARLFYLVPKDL